MKGTRGAVLDEIELWTSDFNRPRLLVERAGRNGEEHHRPNDRREDVRDWATRGFLLLLARLLGSEQPSVCIPHPRHPARTQVPRVPIDSRPVGPVESRDCRPVPVSPNGVVDRTATESGVSTVIIIGALDECRDHQPASAILSVLGQVVSEIPKVKFFLTGRPERRIREGFRLPRMAEVTDVFVLHEVEPRQVESDIRLFFKHSFSELASRWPELEDWPTKEQLNLLCERAAGLFAYAVATVKFIDHRNNDPEEQMNRLLNSSESSAREGKVELKEGMSLNALYTTILYEAFGRDDPEDDPTTRSILGAVALAANPLSPFTIATLLGFRTKSVSLRLSSVHSLLILQEDVNYPIRPFHKSFPDFITDPARCTDQRFHVSPPDHHSELLIGCLELMNRKLEKNMCKLSDGVTNSEVGDLKGRIEQCIDHSLQYACESWHKHLVDPRTVPSHAIKITSALRRFLEEKVLFWLEVLSVLGTVRGAIDAFGVAAKWLEVCSVSALGDLPKFTEI